MAVSQYVPNDMQATTTVTDHHRSQQIFPTYAPDRLVGDTALQYALRFGDPEYASPNYIVLRFTDSHIVHTALSTLEKRYNVKTHRM